MGLGGIQIQAWLSPESVLFSLSIVLPPYVLKYYTFFSILCNIWSFYERKQVSMKTLVKIFSILKVNIFVLTCRSILTCFQGPSRDMQEVSLERWSVFLLQSWFKQPTQTYQVKVKDALWKPGFPLQNPKCM